MKRYFAIVLAVMLLLAAALPGAAMAEGKYTVYISSTGSGTLTLRAGPGTDYGVNGYVYHGDRVTKLDASGIWSRVKTAEGKTGWIKTKYIDGTTRELGTGYKYVKTGGGAVNLRAGAGTGYASKGSVGNGAKVKVLNTEGAWVRVTVQSSGKTGWIMAKYISGSAGSGGGTVVWEDSDIDYAGSVQKVCHVSSSSLNVRTGPGTGYGTKATLYRGRAFRVTASSGNWYKIQTLAGGVTGWVSRTYSAAGATATVTAKSLNMRSSPSGSGTFIRSLASGAKVNVTSVTGNWARITYGGRTGYVSMSYLRF